MRNVKVEAAGEDEITLQQHGAGKADEYEEEVAYHVIQRDGRPGYDVTVFVQNRLFYTIIELWLPSAWMNGPEDEIRKVYYVRARIRALS